MKLETKKKLKSEFNLPIEDREENVLTVYCMSLKEFPIWILFFALGVKSDKEIVDLIDYGGEDARVSNILFASARHAVEECGNFREGGKARAYIEKELKASKYPPQESLDECIRKFLFPNLNSFGKKARYLAYTVKCLLQTYTGRRKCENRADFRNKRLDLAGELLKRELKIQLSVARRQMQKRIQRDLDGDLRPIDTYIEASFITNGLSRAFTTGAWSNSNGKGRISGVVATLKRTNPLQTAADMRKMRQQVNYP